MKPLREHKRRGVWVVLATCAVLTACGGSEPDHGAAHKSAAAPAPTMTSSSVATQIRVAASTSDPATGATTASTEGRLLASNCFQCHGTNGTGGFDNIRGGEAQEITEFLTKAANKDIMAAHAQGYTQAQLQKIITYLQQ